MTKQKAPSFQFYYRDWLHAVRRWDAEDKVEYLEMLCEQADNDSGSIPEKIFNQECLTDCVREKFDKDSNGFFNVRLRDILLKSSKFRQSRLDNLKGSQQKPHKEPQVEPYVEKEKGKRKKKVKAEVVKVETEPLVFPFTDELFMNRWTAWKEYKAAEHKFNFKSQKSEQAALKTLGELSGGSMERAVAIIQRSMSNGWKGLFALDNNNQVNTPAEAADYAQRVKNAMK